jgi:hypothetical protein
MPSVSRGKATCHIALPAMTDGGPPGRSRASPSTSRHGRSTQQASTTCRAWLPPLSRPLEAKRCFLCHSPTLRPWIRDSRLRTSATVAVLRGGALEPEPREPLLKSAGKSTH